MQPWKEIRRHTLIHEPYTKVDRVLYELPTKGTAERDVRKGSGTVVIAALTKKGTVLVNKEFRAGPNKVCMDLPGGYIDPGEEPKIAALRELKEETGYEPESITHAMSYATSGYSTGREHVFIALGCTKLHEQKLDPTEIVESMEMPVEDFKKHLLKGDMLDVTGGLLLLRHIGI